MSKEEKEFISLLEMSPIIEKMVKCNMKFRIGDNLYDAKELYSRIDEIKELLNQNKDE